MVIRSVWNRIGGRGCRGEGRCFGYDKQIEGWNGSTPDCCQGRKNKEAQHVRIEGIRGWSVNRWTGPVTRKGWD